MSPVELIALSLGASIGVAVVAGLAATAFERLSADPSLRERVWALALYLPVLPPVMVGGLLLTPAPERPAMILPVQTEAIQSASVAVTEIVPVATGFTPDGAMVGLVTLAIAAGLIAIRSLSLAWRAARLRRLIARATPASEPACHAVAEAARSLGVAAPSVRATSSGSDALLTGLTHPVLILPYVFAQTPNSAAVRAVIAHELAHLKRGDHRAVWLEEAVLALLAVNPVLLLIRARRAAAREEACDALALSGADAPARRAYAQSLVEALRVRADHLLAVPALTFTGTPRSQAMRRLKSILTPPASAGRGVRVAAVATGFILVGLVGAGSVAVAAQRPAQIVMEDRIDAAPSTPDHAYLTAAMDPIYKVAWPESCGFGSDGPEGQVFVQAGEGCSPAGGPQVLIQWLEGVSPTADPRAAFAAVKAACDANRPVRIAFSHGGTAGLKTAGCASPAVAPPVPVRFTVDITYDPAIAIAVGDRLEIALTRDLGENGKASTGMEFNLAPGALPQKVFADLMPPLLPADRRTGPMFGMTARIIDKDGVVKAFSDRDLGRAHAPYLSTETTIWTKLQMLPATAAVVVSQEARQSAIRSAQAAAAAARAALSPAQRARADAARSGAGFKAICAASKAADVGMCHGVMFGAALRNVGGNICLPEGYDLSVMVQRATSVLASEAVRPGDGATEIATRVIAKAYPCRSTKSGANTVASRPQNQDPDSGFYIRPEGAIELNAEQIAALPTPVNGQARLWLGLETDQTAVVSGDTLVVQISGDGGDGPRLAKAASVTITSAGIPDALFLDLGGEYFPSLGGANRAYTITAQVERGGRAILTATPATLRLAAGSRPMISRLRPVLTLQPVAL